MKARGEQRASFYGSQSSMELFIYNPFLLSGDDVEGRDSTNAAPKVVLPSLHNPHSSFISAKPR